MPSVYDKPFKTVSEQIALLRSYGMDIPDDDKATALLESVGYYRLSGYWWPFRQMDPKSSPTKELRLSTFQPNTSLDQIEKIYKFDRGLRVRVFEAIERVEVAMRFRIGHLLGQSHPFAHHNPQALNPGFTKITDPAHPLRHSEWLLSDHVEFLGTVRKLEARSNEGFVKHFKDGYSHDSLPTWVVTEILTMGALGTLFEGLPQPLKVHIAEEFGLVRKDHSGDESALQSLLLNLGFVRNTCAHHARLWNKNITRKIGLPHHIVDLNHITKTPNAHTRIYATLAALAFLLPRINQDDGWRVDMREYVRRAVKDINQPASLMGFPADWEQQAIWQDLYAPSDPMPKEHRALRRSFKSLTPAVAAAYLFPSEEGIGSKKMRTLRQSGSILGLNIGGTFEYPDFQVDREKNQVYPMVEAANKRLDAKAKPWQAAKWWSTSLSWSTGDTMSPVIFHSKGLMTQKLLDEVLP